MLKVISFKICPFVQRVTGLLEAKNMPYDIEYISLKDKPEWFLEISPHGQVPVLVTESGVALFESDAIVEYIDEISAPIELSESPEQRALDRAWSYLAARSYLAQCSAMRSPDKATLDERTAKIGSIFKKAEQALSSGPYFKGESLGNVDIAWLPLLHRFNIIEKHTGYDFLAEFPKVKKWQQSVLGTGLAERSVSSDFEQKFTGFYLSEDTFLGGNRCCKPIVEDTNTAGSCC